MPLLLTMLSVLAVWTLLTLLILGLFLIRKVLQGVRGHLERIAMGVRAIEREVLPLGAGAEALAASLGEAAGAVQAAARGLAEVDRDLGAAAPALQRPR